MLSVRPIFIHLRKCARWRYSWMGDCELNTRGVLMCWAYSDDEGGRERPDQCLVDPGEVEHDA